MDALKDIKQEVNRRHTLCKFNGSADFDYIYDWKQNPFSYEVAAKMPPYKHSDCVRRVRRHEKDVDMRVVGDVNDANTCSRLNGAQYDSRGIDRKYRYLDGVCWKTAEAAKCGTVMNKYPQLLRPAELQKLGLAPSDYRALVDKARQECEKNGDCAFKRMRNGYDCFQDKFEQLLKDPSSTHMPPADMPDDPQSPEFERFMVAWYSGKLKGNPVPKVMKMKSLDMDACNNNTPDDDDVSDDDDIKQPIMDRMLSVEELRALDPLDKFEDKLLLERALGERNTRRYLVRLKNARARGDAQYAESKSTFNWNIVDLYGERFYNSIMPEVLTPKGIQTVPGAIKRGRPSIVQSVVNMVMKNVAVKDSSTRGLLVLHSTGSGKTATATGVMDAFWDTDRTIVYASSIDALASNPPFKFHEAAYRFFPRWKDMTMEQVAADFQARSVRFLTFAQLSNRIQEKGKAFSKQMDRESIDLDNAVLIVDEVHNLFRPLPTQKTKHQHVEGHLVNVHKHPKLKLVILTATPGDNVEDAMKLVNMVRNPVKQSSLIQPPDTEKNPDDLKRFIQDIRGLVSYFELSDDTSRFPAVIDNASTLLKMPMSAKQFQGYVEAYNNVKKEWRNYEGMAKKNQLGKWWIGARRYANMLFKFEKGMSLTEFSSKLPTLLENLQNQHRHKEKAYVYSAFYERRGSSHGIHEIARQLEQLGWKKLDAGDVKQWKQGTIQPAKRYVLASQVEAAASSDFSDFIRLYNDNANKHGELVSVMVATQNFNEGLDLKAVRHIHIFEPLVSVASDVQTVGRARRYCSHAALDKSRGEWTVRVWRYISIGNANNNAAVSSIDEFVMQVARDKYRQMFQIHHALREAAVDKNLLHLFKAAT